jgi:acetyl esterase
MSNDAITRTIAAEPPALETVTQQFIDALTAAGGPPLYTLSPEAARAVLVGAQA